MTWRKHNTNTKNTGGGKIQLHKDERDTTHNTRKTRLAIHFLPQTSRWDGHIEYSEIFDSTKGYPGEGPPTRKQNNRQTVHTERTEGKLFDSTKGYPGEGPEIRRKKKEITAQYEETNYGTKH